MPVMIATVLREEPRAVFTFIKKNTSGKNNER